MNVTLLQHSCLDAVLNIRDGDRSQRSLLGQGHGLTSTSTSGWPRAGELIHQMGFFNRSEIYVESQSSVLTFELMAKNRSCQINMELVALGHGTS